MSFFCAIFWICSFIGNNIFFPNAARDLLAAILVTIVRLGADSKEFVRKIFYNDRFKEYLDSSSGEKLCELLEGYPDMRSVLSYIKGNNQQSQGVLAEMYSVVRDIFIGVFNEKGGFSLRNFVRQKGGRTLFIEYDLSIGNVLAPVYKIMFDLALKGFSVKIITPDMAEQTVSRKDNSFIFH